MATVHFRAWRKEDGNRDLLLPWHSEGIRPRGLELDTGTVKPEQHSQFPKLISLSPISFPELNLLWLHLALQERPPKDVSGGPGWVM